MSEVIPCNVSSMEKVLPEDNQKNIKSILQYYRGYLVIDPKPGIIHISV